MSSYQKIVLLIGLFGSYIAKAQNTMEYWSGSGIVLASEGFIATNYHVVDKGLDFEVDVFTNGLKKTYSATVIKTDKENDLAVIKISDPSFKSFGSLPYTFRVLDIKVGEKIFAMGYPNINSQGEEVKVTDGIISSKTGYENNNKMYQISAAIQHGNSGGPLFDDSGNLIGITNRRLSFADNVGYAIKISYLNNLLDLIPNFPPLPKRTTIAGLTLPNKIKILSNFTVLIHVKKAGCDLLTPNSIFTKITPNSTYEDVAKLMDNPGDNFRNDGDSNNKSEFYRWVFCDNGENNIECWFSNKKLVFVMKTFNNQSCSQNVSTENYKLISPGISYLEVRKLLNSEGDRFRSDFNSDSQSNFYRWYKCGKMNSYIEVWFNNDKASFISKTNLY